MIHSENALKIILNHTKPGRFEEKKITESVGAVLAENIYSDLNIPPFNRSAMDGFAINSKDELETYTIIEDIPAGSIPRKTVKKGQAARIMTGAVLPKGTDKVVKVEDVESIAKRAMRILNFERKLNVSLAGEDVKKGQLILKSGARVRPQEVAMLATVGKVKVKVFRQPKIAVISTGSELVEPKKKPRLGQIRNSNGPMLIAQLMQRGINGKYLGIARDNFAATRRLINQGLREADILILSGGVSVGDYDFVREVLTSCGVKMHFTQVAIKPGKSTVFGTKEKKLIFGLPGNPVSVLITFELFVVPAIDKILGKKTNAPLMPMKLMKKFQRKDAQREQYYPVRIIRQGVLPLNFHGSAHMQALTQAEGIMQIKRGLKKFKKGIMVDVRPI